ncbi:MAG: transcriptional regulator, AsnC family [Ilumatobacteraceae bacterium]|nr:transcriptional regulator, AsnC family [Ilumatobacteraceae bacterium]MCU1388333.1 transcriptional regulator, AsnC family [Ilumatobacteraceae bacterium]
MRTLPAQNVESNGPTELPIRQIDDLDRAIIDALVADSRLSLTDLANTVNLSRSTVHGRVQRLRDEHVITGFTATVDHAALGLGVAALVLIDIDQHDWRVMRDRLVEIPGVEYLAMCAGRFDLFVLVRADSIASIRDVLLDRIQRIDGVRSTETVFILDEVHA